MPPSRLGQFGQATALGRIVGLPPKRPMFDVILWRVKIGVEPFPPKILKQLATLPRGPRHSVETLDDSLEIKRAHGVGRLGLR